MSRKNGSSNQEAGVAASVAANAATAAPLGRASWSGFLRLSLVVVPVKAYPAVSTTETISFNQLHADCGQRIQYQKVCPLHGKVEAEAIVRGYQYAPDQYVVVQAAERRAQRAFRHLKPEAREDAVQEVLASALVAYVRLVESGKANLAYASPLTMYGICRFKAGRVVGNTLNVRDVTSHYCQVIKGVRVERLDHYDTGEEKWKEILVEDRHAGPAETAAARIDFGDWLAGLPRRQRRIAELLATGESTSEAAEKFRVSRGRVSQIRRELEDSWEEFQGEGPDAVAVA